MRIPVLSALPMCETQVVRVGTGLVMKNTHNAQALVNLKGRMRWQMMALVVC